jgi:hypothetical protein
MFTIDDLVIEGKLCTFDFSGFASSAATSTTVDLPIPGSFKSLISIGARVNTAFAGVTTPQMKIGYDSYSDFLMPLQHLTTVGALKSGKINQPFCAGMDASPVQGQAIRVTFQSTSGNLSDLSAGEVEIMYVYAKEK